MADSIPESMDLSMNDDKLHWHGPFLQYFEIGIINAFIDLVSLINEHIMLKILDF